MEVLESNRLSGLSLGGHGQANHVEEGRDQQHQTPAESRSEGTKDKVEISQGARFAQQAAQEAADEATSAQEGVPQNIRDIADNLGPIMRHIHMLMDEMPSQSLVNVAMDAQAAMRTVAQASRTAATASSEVPAKSTEPSAPDSPASSPVGETAAA